MIGDRATRSDQVNLDILGFMLHDLEMKGLSADQCGAFFPAVRGVIAELREFRAPGFAEFS